MSLFRKLVLLITALVVAMLLGSISVSLHNSRGYFSDQLQALADDTAAHLGLSVSQAALAEDSALIQTMVNAVFDRGHYSEIAYYNEEGRAVVSRSRTTEIEGVPAWFAIWSSIPVRHASAEVVSGWMQAGKLYVGVHPGGAYTGLWLLFVQQCWLAVFVAALGYVLAGLGLKLLLRPLQLIETQANAISRSEFTTVDTLPRTSEFKRVVQAMNRMAQVVQRQFNEQVALIHSLRTQLYLDPVTQLPNRLEFDSRLKAWLRGEDTLSSGSLVLLHAHGVGVLNDEQGREDGDALLRDIATLLQAAMHDRPEAFASRRCGCDFAVFLPGMSQPDIAVWLATLHQQLQGLDTREPLKFWLGASVSHAVCDASRMLHAADAALRLAKSGGISDWAVYPVDDPMLERRSIEEWQPHLQGIIQRQEIALVYQPMFTREQTLLGYEVYSRALEGDDYIAGGLFWPQAERYGLAHELDRLVLQKAVAKLVAEPSLRLSVNLATSSCLSADFMAWLLSLLQQQSAISPRLTLEFHEQVLTLKELDFIHYQSKLCATGVNLALDHFGVSPSALGKLPMLKLTYVKIDRRYVAAIDQGRDNCFYIQILVQIAHGCGVKIFVDGVENNAELQALQRLKVDGVQGYYLAHPAYQINS